MARSIHQEMRYKSSLPNPLSDVHQLGNGRWIVARWIPGAGQYQAPMTAEERRITGCHTYCARYLDNLGGGYRYGRRSDALARARRVYGDAES